MSIFKLFIEAFKGDEEQYARQAFLQAKLEKERRDWLENEWPIIDAQNKKDWEIATRKYAEYERKLFEGFKPP